MDAAAAQSPARAGAWLEAIAAADPALTRSLSAHYGAVGATERVPLLRSVLETFLARFDDAPVRVFRCPGRINLRGMHVDTHGGYLNLMTHHREVVVVSSAVDDDESVFVNTDAKFPEVRCSAAPWRDHDTFRSTWRTFIASDTVTRYVASRRGSWANYVEGATLRAQREWPEQTLRGVHAAVGSDIPRGASLSSSTALSLAAFMSVCAWNDRTPSIESLVAIAQDIEWYAGARIGTSDQCGMLLPGANELVNFAPPLDRDRLRRVALPAGLAVLVIDSHTDRSISGAQQVDYTRNRFAYSLALDVLRQEMARNEAPHAQVERMARLGDFMAPALAPLGGVRALYRWLERVPLEHSLDELRRRYALPLLDEAYERYFGPLPAAERPTSFAIRGPLLFGLAESERARLFIDAIARGDHEVTGYYMTLGHDGDRRYDAMGMPWASDVGDTALRAFAATETPLARVPGAYGASSRALDALVDCAVHAGALGASLTGAGIAGAVVALTEAAYAERIADGVRRYIGSDEYRAMAPNAATLDDRAVHGSVVVNAAPAPAGEIAFG